MNIINRIIAFIRMREHIKYSEADMEMRRYIAGMILMRGTKSKLL